MSAPNLCSRSYRRINGFSNLRWKSIKWVQHRQIGEVAELGWYGTGQLIRKEQSIIRANATKLRSDREGYFKYKSIQ